MKKIFFISILITGIFTLSSCGDPIRSHNLTAIEIEDIHGNDVEAFLNPTEIAIFDWGVLDMLLSVDGFEDSSVRHILLPGEANIPNHLREFFDGGYIRGTEVRTTHAGSLHFISEDHLMMIQPQIVFMGSRAFAQNASGVAHTQAERDAVTNRITSTLRYTRFLDLFIPQVGVELENNMKTIVNGLSAIFPALQEELETKMRDVSDAFADINTQVTDAEATALLVSLRNTEIWVSGDQSRWAFIFEEFGFTSITGEGTNQGDHRNIGHYPFSRTADLLPGATARLYTANVMMVFAHTNAANGPDAAFDAFVGNEIISEAFSRDRIVRISFQAWYSAVGGFISADIMIQELYELVAAITTN